MKDLDVHILIIFIPLIIANVLHMIIVKKNWFGRLAVPVSERLFGKSKTYRGFIVLPVLTGLSSFILYLIYGPFDDLSLLFACLIGAALGLVYMLSELPNSYFKRRLGIASGQSSAKYRVLQYFIDKLDSLIGVFLFYFLFMSISLPDLLVLFVAAFLIHITISYLLVLLRVKKSF